VTAALRHFLERAAERHGDDFEDWFPGAFDWEALCDDAPAMAERLGRVVGGDEADEALVEFAGAVFRAAHLAALSVLSCEADGDPETTLDRLARPLDDEEEETFERLARETLGPLEEAMADEEEPELDPEAATALALASLAWESSEPLLAEGIRAAAASGEEERVLVGIARLAEILAAFRWLAAAAANEDWPQIVVDGGPPE
jgi:hypothetical protein